MDVRVGMRRVADEHRQQPLAAGWQFGEGHAQRRVPLSHQDLLVDHRVVHEKHRVVQACPQPLGFARRGHDAQAFARGGRRQPARQGGGLAELAELLHQQEPDILSHVLDVMIAQPVPGADCIHQGCIAVDKLVPRVLVPPGRAGHERDDMRVVTHGRFRHACSPP